MSVVLYQPQIPENTGNIVRTLAATKGDLFVVPPMGFSLSERRLKRAGLDYFKHVPIQTIDDLPAFLENSKRPFYFFSRFAQKSYTEIPFSEDDLYIFGSETDGLPKSYFEKWPDQFYTIPQSSQVRCLNLSNSAAIILYRSWEALGFNGAHKDSPQTDRSSP